MEVNGFVDRIRFDNVHEEDCYEYLENAHNKLNFVLNWECLWRCNDICSTQEEALVSTIMKFDISLLLKMSCFQKVATREINLLYSPAMGSEIFFKVGGTSYRQKSIENLCVELATVMPQALKYDVINFCQHL